MFDIFQLIFIGFETNNSILLKLEKSEYLRTFKSSFFIYSISDYFIFLKKKINKNKMLVKTY